MNALRYFPQLRRVALVIALCLAAVAAGVAFRVTSADAGPVEMKFACAVTSSGDVRYVASLTECKQNETGLTISRNSPITVCVKLDGKLQYVSESTACSGNETRLTLPAETVTYYCAKSNSGNLRKVNDTSLCASNEFGVFVQQRNRPPDDITLTGNIVGENSVAGTVVGELSASDPDHPDPGETFTFSLPTDLNYPDNTLFQIDTDRLMTNVVFDYEVRSSYTVLIRVTDSGSATYDEEFTIAVTDTNDAPTDIDLSNASVNENESSGTLVGTLSTTDQDAGTTHSYSFVTGTGDTDNASFQIDGDALKTNAVFNYEVKNSYSVRIQTDDGNGGTFQEQFTITIINVNEAPVADDDAYGDVIGNVQKSIASDCVLGGDTDPDGDLLLAAVEMITTSEGGTVVMQADGCFTYNPPPGSKNTTDTFDYTVVDPVGASDTGTVTMTITNDLVWFVDSSSVSGDGRLTNPYSDFSQLNGVTSSSDVDAEDEIIFVYAGTVSYSGGLSLENGQQLIGEPSGLTVAGQAVVIAGGTAPTITNAGGPGLSIASDNTVRSIDVRGKSGVVGTVVGNLTIADVNVEATEGTGVDLADGTLAVSITSVSATGGANGIKLENMTGSFVVTGDGSTADSGGTIQNTLEDGIALIDAESVSFNWMRIANTGRHGISVRNSAATNAASGNPDRLVVTGSTIADSGAITPSDGIFVSLAGTANFQTVVQNSTLDQRVPGNGIDGIQVDAGNTSISDVSVTGSTITGFNTAVNVSGSDTSQASFDISGNPIVDVGVGNAINIASSGDADLRGTIAGNPSISTSSTANNGAGISVVVDQTGSVVVDVDGNTINGLAFGIRAGSRNAGTGAVDLTVRDNAMTTGGSFQASGAMFFAGNGSASESNRVCLNLSSNNIASADTSYFLEQYTSNTFQLQGFTDTGTNATDVQNFVSSRDIGGASVDAAGGSTVNYTAATCATP